LINWLAGLIKIGLPWPETGQPGPHRAAIALILISVALQQDRLLVPSDECSRCRPDHSGVQKQAKRAKDHRLSENGRDYREIHGIADETVVAANDQLLGRSHRCWRTATLGHKSCEGTNQYHGCQHQEYAAYGHPDDGQR